MGWVLEAGAGTSFPHDRRMARHATLGVKNDCHGMLDQNKQTVSLRPSLPSKANQKIVCQDKYQKRRANDSQDYLKWLE